MVALLCHFALTSKQGDGLLQPCHFSDHTMALQVKSDSKVAGQATVCIFPDLNTGNNTYKVC